MKVFVYGTLMSGESNHFFLEERSSKYIRKAVTERGYTLYDLGGFPGMVSGGTGAVMGEQIFSTTSLLGEDSKS